MFRKSLIPVAAATLLLAACGEEEPQPTASRAPADPARYCALSKELDRAGTEFFAALEADKQATEADYEAAEREMVVKFAPKFEAIQAAAPAPIKRDVTILLKAQRERAGLEGSKTPDATVAQAESTIKAFEKREC